MIINEHKEVFVVDRIKELIKVRGFQVAPSELEGHLFDQPDVADVCVVGVPDDYSGELPFAFIVLKDDARRRVHADRKAMAVLEHAIIKVRIHARLAGVTSRPDRIILACIGPQGAFQMACRSRVRRFYP